MPPLPLITKEPICNEELKDLLEEESDYDLTIMVNIYIFHTNYLFNSMQQYPATNNSVFTTFISAVISLTI